MLVILKCAMCGGWIREPFGFPSRFELDETFCSNGCRTLAEIVEELNPETDTFFLKRLARDQR